MNTAESSGLNYNNHGLTFGGIEIGKPTRMCIGNAMFDGYIDRVDQTTDRYEATGFGDMNPYMVKGTPATTLTFKLTAFPAYEQAPKRWNATTTTSKEQSTSMNLYEYAVIYVPLDDKGKPDKKNSKILVGPKTTLAATETSVRTVALREFTEPDLDLDAVKVLVRPFA